MPNEQTSVPLFTSGEVLTAANMNLSAGTGVPVFASTTTRDAAFGGTSEKVLAEGQLCYLSDSNIVQYYTGAAWATVGPSASAVSAVDVSRVNTSQATTSTTYTGLTTAQVITMTTGTKALVLLSFNNNAPQDKYTYASVAVSGATTIAAADTAAASYQQVGAGGYIGGASNAVPLTLTAGSNTFTMQFKNSDASSISYTNRSMTVIAYS